MTTNSLSRGKIYVFAAVIGVLALLLSYLLLLSPKYDEWRAASNAATEADTNLGISRASLAELERKRDDLPNVVGETQAFAANFPNDANQSQLLSDRSEIASENGASASGITAATPYLGTIENGTGTTAALDAVNSGLVANSASSIALVSVTVTVTGDFDQITGVVSDLEQRPEWVSVLRVTFGTSGETTNAAISLVQYLSTPLVAPAG